MTGVWSSTASWNTGQIPGAGGASVDAAIFDGTSQVDVIGETPGGNRLARIVTRTEYVGNVGSPANPLVVQMASELNTGSKCVFRGRGNVYYKSPIGTYADVVVDTDTQDRVVSLSGSLRYQFVRSGKVEFTESSQEITELTVLGVNSHVLLPNNGLTLGNLRVYAGLVDSNQQDWDLIKVVGGHLIQRQPIKDGCDVHLDSGWLEYVTTEDISTHNPDMWLFGGTLDLRKLSQTLIATNLIRGEGVTVLGNLFGAGEQVDGISIDLREEYP